MSLELFSGFLRPEIIAAIMSAIATLFAAIAAWRGPHAAASLAEKLRRDGENASEKRRMKLFVFTTLMQERASFASTDCVRALNLIDVVYYESRIVREAWAEFLLTLDSTTPAHVQTERFRSLLKHMAEDLGLIDGLRVDDLGRFYHPNILAEEERIRILENKERLRRLTGGSDNVTAVDAGGPPSLKWPPRPN